MVTFEHAIYVLASRTFKPAIEKLPVFERLTDDLRRAHMRIIKEQWAGLVMLIGVSAFVIAFSFGIFATFISKSQLAYLAFAFIIAAAIGLVAATVTFYYPTTIAGDRKKKIENSLPFAAIYLNTISRSGFPPHTLFKMLARFKEYGEVAVEANRINNDVEGLGMDLPAALARAIYRSPSNEWTELLAGMRTTIIIGGDLGQYLAEKTKGIVASYKRRLNDYSNFLQLLIEVYITLVIVGTIFFIVTTSIMVAIGGIPVALVKALNYAVVLLGLPALTAAFILIIKGASPTEE